MTQINLPYNIQDGQKSSGPKLMANFAAITNWANAGAGGMDAAVAGLAADNVAGALGELNMKLENRHTKEEAATLLAQQTNGLVAAVEMDAASGVLRVIKKDGTVLQWQTNLHKVPAGLALEQQGEQVWLVVRNLDGSESRADVSALLNLYEFENSEQVAFSSEGAGSSCTVRASLRPSSVGLAELKDEVLAGVAGSSEAIAAALLAAQGSAGAAAQSAAGAGVAAGEAQQAADEAQAAASAVQGAQAVVEAAQVQAARHADSAREDALLAQSYTKGGSGLRENEAGDNAKYYMEQARAIAGGDFATPNDVALRMAAHEADPAAHAELLAALDGAAALSYVYRCTGEADDVAISALVNDFLDNGTALTMKLLVTGRLGLSATPQYGSNTEALPRSFFRFESEQTRGARVLIDWQDADVPEARFSTAPATYLALILHYGAGAALTHYGLTAVLGSPRTVVSGIYHRAAAPLTVQNCRLQVGSTQYQAGRNLGAVINGYYGHGKIGVYDCELRHGFADVADGGAQCFGIRNAGELAVERTTICVQSCSMPSGIYHRRDPARNQRARLYLHLVEIEARSSARGNEVFGLYAYDKEALECRLEGCRLLAATAAGSIGTANTVAALFFNANARIEASGCTFVAESHTTSASGSHSACGVRGPQQAGAGLYHFNQCCFRAYRKATQSNAVAYGLWIHSAEAALSVSDCRFERQELAGMLQDEDICLGKEAGSCPRYSIVGNSFGAPALLIDGVALDHAAAAAGVYFPQHANRFGWAEMAGL